MPFDFSAVKAPFRMQPGLRRLAPGAVQLTPTVAQHRGAARPPHLGAARHLREKLAVLGAFAADAMCQVPGFDAAPALAALSAHAAAEHPSAWVQDSPACRAPGLG